MSSLPPAEGETSRNTKSSKKRNKKRKKKNNQNKLTIAKRNKKKVCKVATTMSEWAENFTVAATWQLKHQVAYWKARATSLEYENRVLHDIIRKNCDKNSDGESDDNLEDSNVYSSEEQGNDEENPANPGSEDDFEVSEEFIQFLMANAKYKEDARRERERLKAEREAAVTEVEETPETSESRQKTWQELYGDQWQRISTLEMALHSQFINESDKNKPAYWPNLPLNIRFN